MSLLSKSLKVWKFSAENNDFFSVNQEVITESIVSLFINEKFWLSFICSPIQLEALGVGFLWNEGLINDASEIKKVIVNQEKNKVYITLTSQVESPASWSRTSTGFTMTPTSPIIFTENNAFKLSTKEIFQLFDNFLAKQALHQSVGGYHSAAISDGKQLNLIVEDIGRHNCLDKLSGLLLLSQADVNPQVILLSGRVSSEMIQKILRLRAKIVISKTTPTADAVNVAEKAGISLVGYIRENGFTIYAHPERIVS
jgi:FdhD protein